MTGIVVSALAPADVDDVARLHAVCFDEAWDAPTIRKVMAMPGAFGLAARDPGGNGIAGFALARVAADECELLSLGVAPDRRRRGIGALLLDTSLVRAAAAAAAAFYLEVAEDNDVARRLYAARGLVPVGRRPDYYRLRDGNRAAAVTMRCDLPTVTPRVP